jgi:hypothetical protein
MHPAPHPHGSSEDDLSELLQATSHVQAQASRISAELSELLGSQSVMVHLLLLLLQVLIHAAKSARKEVPVCG